MHPYVEEARDQIAEEYGIALADCDGIRDYAIELLEDWAVPDAEQLCEAGWLERRTVDANGDTAWFWTQQAETALDMSSLRRDDPADLN